MNPPGYFDFKQDGVHVMTTDMRRPQWFFYPGWVAVSAISLVVAITVYSALIPHVVGAVGDRISMGGRSRITEDFLVPYILWPTLALGNGLLQYLLLRRFLPRIGWWIVATTLGWSLGLFGTRHLYYATLSTALDVHSIWFGVIKVVVTGGTIGLAQWFVLRRRVRYAAWWIIANVFGWGVSAVLSRWLDLWVFGFPAIATVVASWVLLDQLPRRELRKRATSQ